VSKHFRRAHKDENLVVNEHWKRNHPALRVPISGGGKSLRPMWRGDVFAVVGKGVFEVNLVRRTSKENSITFNEKEISDVINFVTSLETLGNDITIVCIAHFPYKGWFKTSLDELGYVSGEILVTKQGEWIVRK
jgi:Holliday junction resolvase